MEVVIGWLPIQVAIKNYYTGRSLAEIMSSSGGDAPGYYFDPKSGNIVVSKGLDSSTFTVITRSSNGKPTTVTASYPEGTSTSEEADIPSMATPWSYQMDNISLLYCPYQTNTFIVAIDNTTENIIICF